MSKLCNVIRAFATNALIGILLAPGQVYAETDNFRLRLHQFQARDLTEKDVGVEIKFGREVAAKILAQYALLKQPATHHYINLVGASLAMHSTRPELDFYFAVLDSPSRNAYSTPGGYVFITKGILDVIRDEAELAAVLAHEIAHISERHIVKELDLKAAEREELSGLARFIGATGSTAQVAFSQAVDQAVKVLFETGYKKRQELEADRVATFLLASTGYDPTSLARILHRLEGAPDQQHGPSKTHPGQVQRLREILKLIELENLNSPQFKRAVQRFQNYHARTSAR